MITHRYVEAGLNIGSEHQNRTTDSPLFGWQVLLMRKRSIQPMTNKEQTVMAVRKDMELSSWTCFSFPASANGHRAETRPAFENAGPTLQSVIAIC